jgi:hypothetical protein
LNLENTEGMMRICVLRGGEESDEESEGIESDLGGFG